MTMRAGARRRRDAGRWRRPSDPWRQTALSDDFTSKSTATGPAPLYHQRLHANTPLLSVRRARRQAAALVRTGLIVLVVIVGALMIARVLGAVKPPPPDDGRVVNLLDTAPVTGQPNFLAETATAPAAFVESPFTQLAELPPINAKSAVLVDLAGRTIIFGQGLHDSHAPASLVKLATAIVALEQAPPDTRIQVPEEAVGQPSNRVGLGPGEVLTLQDLLFAMLLPSANDAAVTVADGIGGDEYTVAQMNDLARRLGLENTRFTNPVGYDDAAQTSTAFDLAVLATHAIERFPLLARIVASQAHVITPGLANRGYTFSNLNGLLWSYDGALGVKTGRTADAGGNMVVAAQRDGMRVLAVVMGSDNRSEDAATLLDYGFRALVAKG